MIKKTFWTCALAASLLFTGVTQAQQFEAVHAVNFESTNRAKAAMDSLFEDDAMKGARVTLYVSQFGAPPASHLVVADFDDYDDYMERNEKRRASHGWARYMLGTADSEYIGSSLEMVVDDHGKPRHTAGYLAAFLIHTTDAAAYRAALADMNESIGNPGVLRLVATRSGNLAATHAVLVGGKDFAAVNEYLDTLYASEAFKEFVAKVGATRKVVGIDMYRRVATWGD